ncbi:hypothetical protein, partial [Streptomyces sp. NPDC127574]|uniref:hypothetical protein n=1 Tax=Streptomyces sp. NPDC127574 TaxID=3345401 RepID=UPI003625F61E
IEGFVEDFWQREFGESAPAPADAAEAAAPSIPPQAGPRDEPIEGAVPAASGTGRQKVRVPIDPRSAEGGDSPDPSAGDEREEDEQGEDEPAAIPGEGGGLTTVDRYYLAWADYLKQHGQEPRDRQLSAVLAEQYGVLGRGGQGVSPSTLRRYLPGWAALREHTVVPTAQDVARECATREISVRKSPVTAEAVESELADFERRWKALARQERRNSSAI